MELLVLQRNTQNKFNIFQALYRLITQTKFEQAYNDATTEERIKVDEYVLKMDKTSVIKWMKDQLHNCMESYSYADLRKKARELGIKNYLYKNRDTLLSEIHQCTVKNVSSSCTI